MKEDRIKIKEKMIDDIQIPYKFFYWGPLLCRLKLHPNDLKKAVKLCSKKSGFVNETLGGVIKHEHFVNTFKYSSIINPYMETFRQVYEKWYAHPLTHRIRISMAWVNFMTAGEFNPPHIHKQCNFSSVLFIKIPEKLKEEHKKFVGSGPGPGSISFTHGQFQPFSMTQKDFFPEEGEFFIFPATLTHFVAPFMCKEERISLSANFTFAPHGE